MGGSIDFSGFPFFSDISRERLSEIESLSFVHSYEKGRVLFAKNEPARHLYGVVHGAVELSLVFEEEIVTKDIKYEEYIRTHVERFERPVVLEQVNEKDIFGWSALVDHQQMTSTATCATDCDIVLMPASDLKKVFSADPELGYIISTRLGSLITHRLSHRTEKLVDAWCQLFDIASIEPPN